jgi:hypothetical protein
MKLRESTERCRTGAQEQEFDVSCEIGSTNRSFERQESTVVKQLTELNEFRNTEMREDKIKIMLTERSLSP